MILFSKGLQSTMPQDYSAHGLCLARGVNDILLDVQTCMAYPVGMVDDKILSI